jgi:glyoxylase-like metal-dependent hydrolase (beta-lactamase superfamily II)
MIAAQPSVESRTLGRFRVHAIQAGGQKLDGGAMFGVVPKPLWERRIPPDERNRIGLGMRCLLVEHDDGLVLIDSGVGNKENAKFREIYGIENEGRLGQTWLEDGLDELGYSPQDVRTVINTHLHFDHAGGNTRVLPSGEVVPTFPNARYVVQRGEHHSATHTNERTGASYFGHNWEAVIVAGQFEFGLRRHQFVRRDFQLPRAGFDDRGSLHDLLLQADVEPFQLLESISLFQGAASRTGQIIGDSNLIIAKQPGQELVGHVQAGRDSAMNRDRAA